jgi:hypothetical protein
MTRKPGVAQGAVKLTRNAKTTELTIPAVTHADREPETRMHLRVPFHLQHRRRVGGRSGHHDEGAARNLSADNIAAAAVVSGAAAGLSHDSCEDV